VHVIANGNFHSNTILSCEDRSMESSTKSEILAFFLITMNDAIFEAGKHVSIEMKNATT
jgi:hypothetical protein